MYGTGRRTAFTPEFVRTFAEEYEARVAAVEAASDYREAVAAKRAMEGLGRAFRDTFVDGLLALWPEDNRVKAVVESMAQATPWYPPGADDPPNPEYTPRDEFELFRDYRGRWISEVRDKAKRTFAYLERVAGAEHTKGEVIAHGRAERVEVAGVSVSIVPMPDREAARSVDVLGEALRILREQKRVPWLLARMPPIEIVLNCRMTGSDGVFDGAYYENTRTTHLCAVTPWLPKSPREVAHTAAHEAGHHIWRTSLSRAARAEWHSLRASAVDALPLRELLTKWTSFMGKPRDRDGFLRRLREHDPELYLRFAGAEAYGDLKGIRTREDLERLASTRASVRSTRAPITAYAEKNDEEAFCEALGMLAAYGPRTVLPEVAQWVRIVVPTVRVHADNGRKARRRARR